MMHVLEEFKCLAWDLNVVHETLIFNYLYWTRL